MDSCLKYDARNTTTRINLKMCAASVQRSGTSKSELRFSNVSFTYCLIAATFNLPTPFADQLQVQLATNTLTPFLLTKCCIIFQKHTFPTHHLSAVLKQCLKLVHCGALSCTGWMSGYIYILKEVKRGECGTISVMIKNENLKSCPPLLRCQWFRNMTNNEKL